MKAMMRHGVPVMRIPYSAAPSAEAARYPGLGAVAAKPAYLDAKRKTLIEFKDKLARLPEAWKLKRLDAFLPASGVYVADGVIRSEANDAEIARLPTLSKDGGTVFFSEEDFDPADDAWVYLSGLVGNATKFPGRGGTVMYTISSIIQLTRQVDAKYGPAPATKWWLWAGLAAVGAVVLWSYFGKGKR